MLTITVKETVQFTGFHVWGVYVNGTLVSGPHVSKELAETKKLKFMHAWNVEKVRKAA